MNANGMGSAQNATIVTTSSTEEDLMDSTVCTEEECECQEEGE